MNDQEIADLTITPDQSAEEQERRWARWSEMLANRQNGMSETETIERATPPPPICRIEDCGKPAKRPDQLCPAHAKSFYKWRWAAKHRGQQDIAVENWLARIRRAPRPQAMKPTVARSRPERQAGSTSAGSQADGLRAILGDLERRRRAIGCVEDKVKQALEALEAL